MSKKPVKRKALFICLGNICRSPIAEGVFKKTITDMGLADEWEIDSAALGAWHVGSPPDKRAMDIMKKNNVPYDNLARQLVPEDFYYFHYIFGMDHENMKSLQSKAPSDSTAKLLLFGDFGETGTDKIIRDPYYDSDAKGFEKAYEQSVIFSKGFMEALSKGEV